MDLFFLNKGSLMCLNKKSGKRSCLKHIDKKVIVARFLILVYKLSYNNNYVRSIFLRFSTEF